MTAPAPTSPPRPAPTGRHPDRVRTGSLRRRVTLATLALLVCVLVGAGVAVHALLADQLQTELRNRLADRADYAAVLYQNGVTGQDLADSTTGDGVDSVVSQGSATYPGTDVAPVPGARPRPRPPGEPPAPQVAPAVSYSEADGFLTATVTLGSNQVQLTADERQIDFTLAQLRTIEVAAGAVVLVVAGGLLWFVVGGSLRPLSSMTRVARSIRDGARGRRLRPTSPRTDLGRTAVAFDEMLDSLEAAELRAQRAEERMRQFLADASHDLRTPIAGVIAGSERLLLDDGASRQEREQRTLDVIRQARRAARLVDDVLLTSRLEGSPGDELRPLDVAALVGQQVAAARTRGGDGPPVIAPLPPGGAVTVTGDADALRRAVDNLLDNATRFARERVEVTVLQHGHPGGPVGPWVEIAVADDGPGVPPADRQRVFERFVRLDAARQGAGSGLGLPIAAAIAARHGGGLDYRESRWGGACLVLTLPVRQLLRQGAAEPLSSS